MSFAKLTKIGFFLLVGLLVAQAAQAQTFTVVWAFQGANGGWPNGAYPYANVLLQKGQLWCTTHQGGQSDAGAAFVLDATGKLGGVEESMGGAWGAYPSADLIWSGGKAYGTNSWGGTYGGGTIFQWHGVLFTALYSFQNGLDGQIPLGTLVRDKAGNLYGTTSDGGAFSSGTLFKLDPSGKLTVLYTFASYPGDAARPRGNLVRDAKGNFYGTTQIGGAYGYGTVFKIDASGNETVIHSFTGGSDGGYPWAGVIRDSKGNLYGTTYQGGDSVNCPVPYNCGVVFKIDKKGKETILHAFTGYDGRNPVGTLLRDTAGNLYGTTMYGGQSNILYWGTVFKLDPAGNETLLHVFTGYEDGAYPLAGLTRDKSGNLWGTASQGGDKSNSGVIFKITP
jgi:uncharacterized repeat protein (TIGR03803 family)